MGNFSYQIDMYSVFKEEFGINYTIYSSHILKNTPLQCQTNPWFADKLVAIYDQQDNLANHPDVMDGFISNNSHIIEYFNQHTEVISEGE